MAEARLRRLAEWNPRLDHELESVAKRAEELSAAEPGNADARYLLNLLALASESAQLSLADLEQVRSSDPRLAELVRRIRSAIQESKGRASQGIDILVNFDRLTDETASRLGKMLARAVPVERWASHTHEGELLVGDIQAYYGLPEEWSTTASVLDAEIRRGRAERPPKRSEQHRMPPFPPLGLPERSKRAGIFDLTGLPVHRANAVRAYQLPFAELETKFKDEKLSFPGVIRLSAEDARNLPALTDTKNYPGESVDFLNVDENGGNTVELVPLSGARPCEPADRFEPNRSPYWPIALSETSDKAGVLWILDVDFKKPPPNSHDTEGHGYRVLQVALEFLDSIGRGDLAGRVKYIDLARDPKRPQGANEADPARVLDHFLATKNSPAHDIVGEKARAWLKSAKDWQVLTSGERFIRVPEILLQAAIWYAAQDGRQRNGSMSHPVVVNVSYYESSPTFGDVLEETIDRAKKMVVVAAAGNTPGQEANSSWSPQSKAARFSPRVLNATPHTADLDIHGNHSSQVTPVAVAAPGCGRSVEVARVASSFASPLVAATLLATTLKTMSTPEDELARVVARASVPPLPEVAIDTHGFFDPIAAISDVGSHVLERVNATGKPSVLPLSRWCYEIERQQGSIESSVFDDEGDWRKPKLRTLWVAPCSAANPGTGRQCLQVRTFKGDLKPDLKEFGAAASARVCAVQAGVSPPRNTQPDAPRACKPDWIPGARCWELSDPIHRHRVFFLQGPL